MVEAQAATNNRFIYTRSEYNAQGQLVKQYRDTGWNTTPTAPTLFEYDSFGNLTRQTLALAEEPTPANSPITEWAYSVETTAEGVFSCTTQSRYNAAGGLLVSVQKQLISQLSPTLAEKVIAVDERGLTSADWVVYNNSTKRTRYSSVPTSDITAETVVVDGFTLSQKDTAGIITTATRAYTAGGMVLVHTDGRGNATTSVTDIAGRTLTVTDAAGNVTTTAYDAAHDQPATITDAMGNTTCYRYDERGRKVAEWGTGIQPACFGYDEADNLVSLKTFRSTPEANEDGSPSQSGEGAAAGDETTWSFDPATNLELSKTYADNSSAVKTYDAFNRLATETDARGIVKTHSYDSARGLLLGTSYSDATAPRSFAYNHLGQLTQVTDDAGTRTIGYNAFGEQETDSLLAGDKTHLITETRDALGRSTGFTYSKDGTVQHSVTTGYGADGRIATAGFMHGGSEKQFSYGYLPGSHLLQTLTMPCNMTLTQSYETQRDLLIGMAYHRGNTLVTQRSYSYDTLGRPLTRSTNRSGQTVNDSFGYNTRSELTSATVNSSPYGYDYDHIGNRITAEEGESSTEYTANELNQYTAVGDFSPTFDADGNQTLVKTATGIWSVEYNAENRPVRFTSADGATIIECSYDTMGRRTTKKVTVNGNVTLHQRYIYRGYLQIACCDLTRAAHPALWFLLWDPTQPIATRPLAIRKDGTWFAYGWDLTKNICEVFGPAGYIRTAYSYSPYGSVTATGDVTQPIQWSSEYNDAELSLVYYNYRHYNPVDGRWLGRDLLFEMQELNHYAYIKNASENAFDALGLRRVAGSYKDDKAIIRYDYDVAIVQDKGNCFLRFTVLIDFEYKGSGSQDSVDALLKNVESLLQRNLSNINIEIKSTSNTRCCCKTLSVMFVVARKNSEWLNQGAPFIKPTSKAAKVIYNPSDGTRSDAKNWKNNNPSTALHEILHLYGLADEYYDEHIYPSKTEDKLPSDHKTSAMGINANSMKDDFIKPRHIEDIINRSNVKNKELKNCNLSIS